MSKITTNKKKKVLHKLEQIGIKSEKDILNLKVMKLMELDEQEKFTLSELETIWKIQNMILERDVLKAIKDT